MGLRERSKLRPVCVVRKELRTTHNNIIVEREPTVMGIMPLNIGSYLMVHLLERDYRTALHPLDWKSSVSLLIPIPQIFQKTFPVLHICRKVCTLIIPFCVLFEKFAYFFSPSVNWSFCFFNFFLSFKQKNRCIFLL